MKDTLTVYFDNQGVELMAVGEDNIKLLRVLERRILEYAPEGYRYMYVRLDGPRRFSLVFEGEIR